MNLLSAHVSPTSPAQPRAAVHRRGRTRKRPTTLAFAATVLLVLVASACGGGTIDVAELANSTRADATDEQQEVPVVEDEGSIEDVAAATVKIFAVGTFVPPYELQRTTAAGSGTGFIIDESGLLVTNNHVVTGAAVVEVYLEGETEPLNARILGVSECNDLAVLDLEGEGYESLEFRSEPVNPGLTIYSAGYPGNFDTNILDVDYTLTTGIVSTTQGGGESPWASVDGVIEHDARIRSGNSGGPLVDEQGRVVGINFAGDDTNDLNFAISAQDSLSVIEALKSGDVESLGINGEAIINEDFSGIWVAAVEPGTPADSAGLQGGDVILTMQGLDLAVDGTMSAYCDIIRTNGPDTTMAIEVLRISTEEVLTGQINGKPLTQSFSFAQELAEDVGDDGGVTAGYDEYVFISDDSGSVGVDVPAAWTERDGEANPKFGESIWAAPNLTAFNDGWEVPGIVVERNADLSFDDIDSVLDDWQFDCANSSGRAPFKTDDEVFAGKYELFTDCGGTGTAVLTVAVSPPTGDSVVRMLVQIVSDADLEAADRAIATFDSAS